MDEVVAEVEVLLVAARGAGRPAAEPLVLQLQLLRAGARRAAVAALPGLRVAAGVIVRRGASSARAAQPCVVVVVVRALRGVRAVLRAAVAAPLLRSGELRQGRQGRQRRERRERRQRPGRVRRRLAMAHGQLHHELLLLHHGLHGLVGFPRLRLVHGLGGRSCAQDRPRGGKSAGRGTGVGPARESHRRGASGPPGCAEPGTRARTRGRSSSSACCLPRWTPRRAQGRRRNAGPPRNAAAGGFKQRHQPGLAAAARVPAHRAGCPTAQAPRLTQGRGAALQGPSRLRPCGRRTEGIIGQARRRRRSAAAGARASR